MCIRDSQEAEVGCDRLLECKDFERASFEDSVEVVDGDISRSHGIDEIEPVLEDGLARAAGVLDDERTHLDKAAPNLVDFVVEVMTNLDLTALFVGVFRVKGCHIVS